jgi:cytidylate kinase
MQNAILALVGMPAAGKSTVSEILQRKFGYNWIRTRDIVKLFAANDGIDSLQASGVDLSVGSGAQAFCTELYRRISSDEPNVIDAIRPVEHWRRIKHEYSERVVLVSVVAPLLLRQQRIKDNRKENIEARAGHEVEADVPSLIDESTYTIVNRGDLDFRVQQLVDFVTYNAG